VGRRLNRNNGCGKFPDMEKDKTAPQGNPNPSPSTRFGAGERANPQGRTSEQRKMEIANAEKATKLRGMLLDAATEHMDILQAQARMDHIDAAFLKLLTDSETRGLGAPTQHVDSTSSDGSMSPPSAFIIEGVAPKKDND